MVLAVYGLMETFHPGGLMAYVFPSACWVLLTLATVWACGFKTLRSWFNRRVTIVAALVAIFYIIIYMDIGLFTGFGRSPLSFTPKFLMINFILVSSTLLGMEFSRAYIVKSFGRKRPFLTIGLVTLLYTFINVSVIGLLSFRDPLALSRFLGIGLLPIIAVNLLASYLALIGGPIASLAYRAPLMALTWFSPILPDLSWGIESLLGVMVPTMSFLAINWFIPRATLMKSGILTRTRGFGRNRGSSMRGWMIASVLCVLVVWASTGLFGIRPTTVISGSMRPIMDVGDMAIIRNAPADSIEVGDIIQYWNSGEMTIHRVVDIQQGESGKLFVTKGDATSTPDLAPVGPSQVIGKVVLNIPKVGWAAIATKEFFSGAWSLISANTALTVLAGTSGVFIFYMFRSHKNRSVRRWRGSRWGRKGLGDQKFIVPLSSMLILLAITGFAYSHWTDSVQISGTVKMGHREVEKTFRLTVKCCVKLDNVTYWGAVKLDTIWRSVELELTSDGYGSLCKPPPCKDKIYTGTISDLPVGIYEWKIYYVDNLGENHKICSGTENLSGSVTNRCTLGCTSLDICKTVKCNHAEHENGYIYIIEGNIIVRNVGEYPAIVVDVSDTIEYKIRGGDWESLTPISFTHNVPEVIPLGGPYYYTYTCRFSTENILALGGYSTLCKPSWRNLIEITISNHPLGMHTFHDRADFELGDG